MDTDLRPSLARFRLVEFKAENNLPQNGRKLDVSVSFESSIEIGLQRSDSTPAEFSALVTIRLNGKGTIEDTAEEIATFDAKYVARFMYPAGVSEEYIESQLGLEPHQFVLVAQAFTLAASHYRSQLSAMGFDVGDQLPLGVNARQASETGDP